MSYITIHTNQNFLEDNIRSLVKVSKYVIGLSIHDNSHCPKDSPPVAWSWCQLVSLHEEQSPPTLCTLEMKYTPYFLPSALCPCPIDIIYDSTQNRFIFLSHIIAITILENKSHGYYI